MKSPPDLPLHLAGTQQVLRHRVHDLKAITETILAADRLLVARVLEQLEDTLAVLEAAWLCAEAVPGDMPASPEAPVLH